MEDATHINGYQIVYNDYWKMWTLSHPIVGVCGHFNRKEDAINEAKKG